jgi:hypothetical protein
MALFGQNTLLAMRKRLEQHRADRDMSGLRPGTSGQGSAVQTQLEMMKAGGGAGLSFSEFRKMMGGPDRFGGGIIGYARARAAYAQFRRAHGQEPGEGMTPEPEDVGEFDVADAGDGISISDLTFGG